MSLTTHELNDICQQRLRETVKRRISAVSCVGDRTCESGKLIYDVRNVCHPLYQSWLLYNWMEHVFQ